MKRENFLLLLNQFATAKGIKNIDSSSKEFMDEFSAWIIEMQKAGELFKTVLDDMEYDYKSKNVVEANKSKQDSLILPYDSTLITPFYDGLEISHTRLYPAIFGMSDNTPTAYTDEYSSAVNLCFLNSFMVNNPYDQSYLYNIENIFNNGFLAGEVGFYGFINDKNYEQNIKLLEEFKENISRDYQEQQVTIGDCYGLVLTSKRNK